MAPEIPNGRNYEPSVDLWSAGVIVLEYGYGFPEQSTWSSWCHDIGNYANEMAGGLDPLINILQTGMLKMEPRERLSAHGCLKRIKTDLLSNDTLGIGGTTPTEKTALVNNDTLGIGGTTPTEETALVSNDTIGIGGTTPTEETALRVEVINKGSITAMAEALRSQEPTHTSETIEGLCKTTFLMIMAVLAIRMRGSFEAKSPQILTMMAVLEVSLERSDE
ncbi:hypothetical protein MMC31_006190 [Peltigera leucophlebia]|nr:hypothetical protein [Peltigera leucophlebia]